MLIIMIGKLPVVESVLKTLKISTATGDAT